jgi:hypothetical protein
MTGEARTIRSAPQALQITTTRQTVTACTVIHPCFGRIDLVVGFAPVDGITVKSA